MWIGLYFLFLLYMSGHTGAEKQHCSNGMIYAKISIPEQYYWASRSCPAHGYNLTNFDDREVNEIEFLLKECNITINGLFWIKKNESGPCRMLNITNGMVEVKTSSCTKRFQALCETRIALPSHSSTPVNTSTTFSKPDSNFTYNKSIKKSVTHVSEHITDVTSALHPAETSPENLNTLSHALKQDVYSQSDTPDMLTTSPLLNITSTTPPKVYSDSINEVARTSTPDIATIASVPTVMTDATTTMSSVPTQAFYITASAPVSSQNPKITKMSPVSSSFRHTVTMTTHPTLTSQTRTMASASLSTSYLKTMESIPTSKSYITKMAEVSISTSQIELIASDSTSTPHIDPMTLDPTSSLHIEPMTLVPTSSPHIEPMTLDPTSSLHIEPMTLDPTSTSHIEIMKYDFTPSPYIEQMASDPMWTPHITSIAPDPTPTPHIKLMASDSTITPNIERTTLDPASMPYITVTARPHIERNPAHLKSKHHITTLAPVPTSATYTTTTPVSTLAHHTTSTRNPVPVPHVVTMSSDSTATSDITLVFPSTPDSTRMATSSTKIPDVAPVLTPTPDISSSITTSDSIPANTSSVSMSKHTAVNKASASTSTPIVVNREPVRTPTYSYNMERRQVAPTSTPSIATKTTATPINTTVSSFARSTTQGTAWLKLDNNMYHINDQLLPFSEAERECKERLHGNLLLVTSPRRYLVLASVLNLQYGSYWIGETSEGASGGLTCLVLVVNRDNSTSLSIVDRNQSMASVCSRIANITAILQRPEFVQMVQELTVDTKTTKMALRRLSSADDMRPSAKRLGGSAGAILVGICVGIVILLDIPWHLCCCHRH